jgi:hypothetical protein
MHNRTNFARVFFLASLAMMLGMGISTVNAQEPREAEFATKRPPAPDGCTGITTPVCAEAELGGFVYKYYFLP